MRKYDIYWFRLRYEEDFMEDNPRRKERPVLVLNDNGIINIVSIAKITSQYHKNNYQIRDWKEAGLFKPCWVDFSNREIISADKLRKEDYIGHLSDYDIQRIKSQKLDENIILEV